MPITLNDAHKMLKEEDCPFSLEGIDKCLEDPSRVLFTWENVDFYLAKEL